MLKTPRDMTRVVDLTREKGTGPTRTRRPIYVDLLPPCNNACPAGENIQEWLALAQAMRCCFAKIPSRPSTGASAITRVKATSIAGTLTAR